jgi:hypothetical protein
MKHLNPIQWAIHALRISVSPPEVLEDYGWRMDQLSRIARESIMEKNMQCPWPGCNYCCQAPEDASNEELIICPDHSCPMEFMTWKQMCGRLSLVIDKVETELRTIKSRLYEMDSAVNEAWRQMREARAEAVEARGKLDEILFIRANTRESLDELKKELYESL